MDNKLLILWRYFSSGSIRTEEIAEALQISQKQTTRYLKKWTDEGWLTFTPGRGRGNVSHLKWHKDVEEIFEEEVTKAIDTEPVEKSSKYLMYDWSTDSKMRLMNRFHAHLGFVQQAQDKLVVPKRYPFLSMHPLEAADAHSAHMVANVFNRLVALTDQGELLPELAHSWDVSPTKLRLYLRKDVRFHDGSVLSSQDVVDCLEKLRVHKHNKELWAPIEEVVSKAPLTVDILHPRGCSYSLYLLSTMTASIYKENKGKLYGTGGFLIEENTSQKTALTAFKDHFQERPLLDAVEFVQVPKDFPMIYQSAVEQKSSSTFQVESDSGFGVVIMNAYRDGSIIQKKEVRHYLHKLLAANRHKIHDYEPRTTPNNESCLIGQKQKVHIPEATRPVFTEPIVVRASVHTENTTRWLIDTLEKDNIPVEVRRYPFEEVIHNRAHLQEVDIFIHGEIFESNQDLSFYFFLRNGYAPLPTILNKDEKWKARINEYVRTPFEEWTTLNAAFEKELIEESIMLPLYYEKRFIPFSSELTNVNIKHFGYVDFSKLWVRPQIEE